MIQADSKPIDALPEDPTILQEFLLSAWSERDRFVAERNELAEQNERLQHLVLKLTRLKFGTKSERLPDEQLQWLWATLRPSLRNWRRKARIATQRANEMVSPNVGPAVVRFPRICHGLR